MRRPFDFEKARTWCWITGQLIGVGIGAAIWVESHWSYGTAVGYIIILLADIRSQQ